MAAVKFEQAMARLEAIVGELEKNDLPLDESLKILEEAEHKVEVLVQDKNGKKRIHAYSSDDAADETSS